MLSRFGKRSTRLSEAVRMCAWGIGRMGAAVVGMCLLGGLLSWMSFRLPQRVQFEPHVEASWWGEMGYGTLGGTLVLIRGHWVVRWGETARRCVFWNGDDGALGGLVIEDMGGEGLGEAEESPAWRETGRYTSADLARF
jgi:hypothetical protein